LPGVKQEGRDAIGQGAIIDFLIVAADCSV